MLVRNTRRRAGGTSRASAGVRGESPLSLASQDGQPDAREHDGDGQRPAMAAGGRLHGVPDLTKCVTGACDAGLATEPDRETLREPDVRE